jgi:hypothetical protein
MQRSPLSKFVPRQRGLWMVSLSLLLTLCAASGCKNERDRNSAGDDTRGKSTPATLGMVITDQISPTYGDHTDWKSYAVPAPGVLAIRVYWDASDKIRDGIITVHDKYGMQLAERLHDPNVSIDELLVRVDQGFYYVKVGAERGESIYSIQGQHLLVSPSDDGGDGSIPTMASPIDIQLPGAATASAEGAAAPASAEAGAAGAASPNLAFIDDSNLGFLVPPDIDPEEPVRAQPLPAPAAEAVPIPVPAPQPTPAPAPMAVPPTPKPPAASMESFGEPTGERTAAGGGMVGFAAGLDAPIDPAPAPTPKPAPAKVAEPIEAKIILAEASGPGTTLLLKCADDRVSEGQKVEVFDTSGKVIDTFSIMSVDGSRCSAESSRASSDFSSIGRVVIYIPN